MQGPTPQDGVDARLSRIEGIVEQMNTRLTNIESSVVVSQRWIIRIQFTTLIAQFLDLSRPDQNIDG